MQICDFLKSMFVRKNEYCIQAFLPHFVQMMKTTKKVDVSDKIQMFMTKGPRKACFLHMIYLAKLNRW